MVYLSKDPEYLPAKGMEEALALLSKYKGAKVLAGGQTLIQMMRLGLSSPEVLVDINKIGELSYIKMKDNNVLSVGALTRHAELLNSSLVRTQFPALYDAISNLGDPQVRNRGTIGGSVASALTQSHYLPVLLLSDATIITRSLKGVKTYSYRTFFKGQLTTALSEGEIITEIEFPNFEGRKSSAYTELKITNSPPIASAVASIVVESGKISNVRVVLGGVTPIPVRRENVENALLGKNISEEQLREASKLARQGLESFSDALASAEYRLSLANVLVFRALRRAYDRFRGVDV